MRKQSALDDEAAKASAAYLEENATKDGVTVTESGLQYEVITAAPEGAAKPTAQSMVRVHYHGTLTDGSVFDSSVERGQPAEFDRKSTRLNSSHVRISYAVFCLKKK